MVLVGGTGQRGARAARKILRKWMISRTKMHRKTDFYRTLTEESQVGFPVGVPENMLRCYFSKYNQKTKNDERKAARNKIKVEADPTCIQPAPEVKPEVQIKEPVQQSVKPKATIPKDQDEWQNNPDSHNGAVRFKLL